MHASHDGGRCEQSMHRYSARLPTHPQQQDSADRGSCSARNKASRIVGIRCWNSFMDCAVDCASLSVQSNQRRRTHLPSRGLGSCGRRLLIERSRGSSGGGIPCGARHRFVVRGSSSRIGSASGSSWTSRWFRRAAYVDVLPIACCVHGVAVFLVNSGRAACTVTLPFSRMSWHRRSAARSRKG